LHAAFDAHAGLCHVRCLFFSRFPRAQRPLRQGQSRRSRPASQAGQRGGARARSRWSRGRARTDAQHRRAGARGQSRGDRHGAEAHLAGPSQSPHRARPFAGRRSAQSPRRPCGSRRGDDEWRYHAARGRGRRAPVQGVAEANEAGRRPGGFRASATRPSSADARHRPRRFLSFGSRWKITSRQRLAATAVSSSAKNGENGR